MNCHALFLCDDFISKAVETSTEHLSDKSEKTGVLDVSVYLNRTYNPAINCRCTFCVPV